MNYDQILDKPFLVTTIPWSTATTNFTELWRLPFPSSIMSNPLAKVPFNASALYQAKMCCMLQVSGTPMHQGLLLVAALPHGIPTIVNPNQILSAPHVFLNATESTSVCLECPMYTPTSLYRTQDPTSQVNNLSINTSYFGTDVFDLVFFVMDALTTAVGSSTEISISVHNIFKTADFYIPKVGEMAWQAQCGTEYLACFKCFGCRSRSQIQSKCVCGVKVSQDSKSEVHEKTEFNAEGIIQSLWNIPTKIVDAVATGLKVVSGDLIDMGRAAFRTLTGFHNPNIPSIDNRMIATFRNFPNNVDQPVRLEVLDNHAQFSRVYDDYYFRTAQDEMDLKYLTSKPVFIGKFVVSGTDATGKNLFAYPITPMVEASVAGNVGNTQYCSPLRTIYESSRHWRGGLKLHIQAVCTNFHFAKIIILKNYYPTRAVLSTTAVVPQYSNIHNINTDTLEFSAGGQIQTIDLPYCSNFRQLECTKDFGANSVAHGTVYGYLVQPLVYNSNVPTTVTFNVYMSGGSDLEFSGYATDNVNIINGGNPVYPGVPGLFKTEKGQYEIQEEKGVGVQLHTGRFLDAEQQRKAKLEIRKDKFFTDKPKEYIVQSGDTWEDIAFITGNTIEALRHANALTHNSESKLYSTVNGPKLTKGEKLKFVDCWRRKGEAGADTIICFKAEGMEEASGVNTLVTTNEQEPLLNKPSDSDQTTKMAFRPNTSIRDYLRFMYPQRTVTQTPVATENVVPFSLSNYFTGAANSFTNLDSFHSLSSLFLGLSGGLKLKFKITGCTSASAMYVPPSKYNIGGEQLTRPCNNILTTEVNSLSNFISQMSYHPTSKSFTAPQIEMQDYTRPFNNSGANVGSKPGNAFELEMAIPNLNECNYTFNATKYFQSVNAPVDLECNLGTVYINYEASYDGTTYAPVTIIMFLGLNDEARLGYQVYCPIKSIPTYSTTAPVVVSKASLFHPGSPAGVGPYGVPVNPLPISGSSYYFKST